MKARNKIGSIKPCPCDLCKRSRRVGWIIRLGDIDKLKALIGEIYGSLLAAEQDNNYYKSIMDGCWPQSVQILTKALAAAKKKAKEVKP